MSLFLSLLNSTRACLLPGHLLNPSQSVHFSLFLPELHLLLLMFCFRLQMTLFISTLNDNLALPSCRLSVWAQWRERQPCLWAHLCSCPGPWPTVFWGVAMSVWVQVSSYFLCFGFFCFLNLRTYVFHHLGGSLVIISQILPFPYFLFYPLELLWCVC